MAGEEAGTVVASCRKAARGVLHGVCVCESKHCAPSCLWLGDAMVALATWNEIAYERAWQALPVPHFLSINRRGFYHHHSNPHQGFWCHGCLAVSIF